MPDFRSRLARLIGAAAVLVLVANAAYATFIQTSATSGTLRYEEDMPQPVIPTFPVRGICWGRVRTGDRNVLVVRDQR